VPVAVSVPANAVVDVTMTLETWAFGTLEGEPAGL